MSAASASATVRKTCSVCESMTLIFESDEGATHSPPMKKRSVCLTGTVASPAEVVIGSLPSSPPTPPDNRGIKV
jgi:hypothetical protein